MTLLSIVLVPKTGVLQAVKIKEFSEDDLFKRAGFKSGTDFQKRHIYRLNDSAPTEIHVYGKVTGRAGQENKYEFPPPIDEVLFFGTVLLVAHRRENDDDAETTTTTPVSLTQEEWESMYDILMGGFEDIENSTTVTSSSVDEELPEGTQLTRDGFVKDGFVVDDDEVDEEEEQRPMQKKKPAKNAKTTKPLMQKPARVIKKKKTTEQVVTEAVQAMVDRPERESTASLDCSQELTEEDYVA